MCGIVGYAGQLPGKPIILEGLRRLEYRGYDSAGIVLMEDDGTGLCARGRQSRRPGGCRGPRQTHRSPAWDSVTRAGLLTGAPSHANAHPHDDCTGRVSIVPQRHHRELQGAARRARAPEAMSSSRETDAEVVVHLMEENLDPPRFGGSGAGCRRSSGGPLGLLCHLGRRARRSGGRHAPRGAAGGGLRRRRDLHRHRHPGLPEHTRHVDGARGRRHRQLRAEGAHFTPRRRRPARARRRPGLLGCRRRRKGRP